MGIRDTCRVVELEVALLELSGRLRDKLVI